MVIDLNNEDEVWVVFNNSRGLVVANRNHPEQRQIRGYSKEGELVVRQDGNHQAPKWVAGVSPQAKRFFIEWLVDILHKEE